MPLLNDFASLRLPYTEAVARLMREITSYLEQRPNPKSQIQNLKFSSF